MIIYDAEMSNNMIPSNSPPAEVQIVSMEPPALTLVIVPYPLEHCNDWQLSACRSLGGNCRAAVFTSRSLIASASVVLSHDYTTHSQPFNSPLSGQTRWDGIRRNIHPLTPILIVKHPLSTSYIYYVITDISKTGLDDGQYMKRLK